MTEEVWKAVPGFEGLYEVSDQGRVRSFHRVQKGRVLKLGPHPGGYRSVHLYRDGQRARATVLHILVAEVFLGPRPDGQEVCHNDGVKVNCAAANLRYDFPTGNNSDKREHGTLPVGEASSAAKLTEEDVREIRARRGESQKDLADEFGVTFSNISAVQLRKSWAHV